MPTVTLFHLVASESVGNTNAEAPMSRAVRRESDRDDAAVVVAVVPVLVVQMPRDQVVGVLAVRYRLVPTARAVAMVAIVPAALVPFCARVGIRRANRESMVVDVAAVHVVEVSAVQVVRMTGMLNGGVTASGAVLVAIVVLVLRAVHLVTAFPRKRAVVASGRHPERR